MTVHLKKTLFYWKVIYRSTFESSFQYYEETVEQWVRDQRDGIVIYYDLVKINYHKSQSFYNASSLEDFSKMLKTEWAKEWDKANNCKDIVYKLELVERLINGMINLGKKISWTWIHIHPQMRNSSW